MKEVVIVSGKGGTGKTSLVASFASLATGAVVADCDVDAPDLHLVLDPRVEQTERFHGLPVARIRPGHCTACGKCEELCRFEAIFFDGPGNGKVARTFRVDPVACEGCGVCEWFCADGAIRMEPIPRGAWSRSRTRFGPMVHGRLDPGSGNSGKLVDLIRQEALKIAEKIRAELILVDGPPGVGCPVIASVTNASMVVAVTEPSLSGEHDLGRLLSLAEHFGIPSAVCVNRWDVEPEIADRIERTARATNCGVLPRVRFDEAIVRAQNEGRAVTEIADGGAADDVAAVFDALVATLGVTGQRRAVGARPNSRRSDGA